MNEQLIDTVISPVVTEQVTGLTKILADLDIQMSADIKSANLLNTALANSKSFTEYNNNATKAALQLEKVQQAQNKTAQSTITLNNAQAKAAADQQARDDKALLALQKKQAAQATADAKEIANAEAKAAKLQAIADKQIVTQRTVQVEMQSTQTNYLSNQMVDDQPKMTPVPAGEPSDMRSSGLIMQQQKANAGATDEETAALTRQREMLLQLSPEYVANIELLSSLKAEQLENAAALKSVNAETVEGADLQTVLVANQLRLKLAVSEVNMALGRQTKEVYADEGAIKQLNASVLLLSEAYESLSVAERQSEQGQKMGIELAALRTEQNALGLAVKNTKNNVGNYTDSINKSSLSTQLADKVTNQFIRSIIRMGVQFLLIGVAFKAVEWLYDYVKGLNMFIDVATEAEIKQKALTDAFSSSDYTSGVESIEKLTANLDLATGGILDSDKAINEYNDTIGKTFGYVNNLKDAQQGLIDHSDEYVQSIYLEAAAQAALADSAKFAAEMMAKNVSLREQQRSISADIPGAEKLGFSKNVIQNQKEQVRNLNNEIDENNKKALQNSKNTVAVIKDLYKAANQTTGNSSAGPDPVNDLRTKISNDQLEHEKIIAQNKLSNDKLSYSERLKAVQEFYNASEKIETNNENAELVKLPANDARREQVTSDFNNKMLQLTESRHKAVQELKDKQYKQDQEHFKNKITAQKDLLKSVLDDPNINEGGKLATLEIYNKRELDLISANYKEQQNEAGKNDKALLLADDNKAKSELELKNYIADETVKIAKEELEKRKKLLAEMLTASKESEQEQLETLDQANILVNQAREKQKNKLIEDKDTELANGKIKGKEYREAVQDINDAYNIRKIADEIVTQKAILELREATKQKEINDATSAGATPEELKKIGSEADKGIQPVKNKLGDSDTALQRAITTRDNHQTTNAYKDAEDKKKAIEQAAYEVTVTAIDEVDKLRQRAYENEIARLEKRAALVEDNANNEKLLVNASIASSATKAREIALIDAQAASAKKAIQVEENQIKTKEAKAEKEAAIAKIIVNGALAIVKAFAEGGLVLEALAIATVGVELATAIATPLPTFAKGTKHYPGGLGIWGEAGQELATLPDGSRQLSSGAAIANFPKGTVITPHMELMQMIRPEPIKYVGGQEIGWQEVLAQLKKMEPKAGRTRVNVNVDMGYESYKSSYLRR